MYDKMSVVALIPPLSIGSVVWSINSRQTINRNKLRASISTIHNFQAFKCTMSLLRKQIKDAIKGKGLKKGIGGGIKLCSSQE